MTEPKERVIRHPYCTQNGTKSCDLKIRQAHRGGKSVLPESVIRRLNPKGDLNEKYGGYIQAGKLEVTKGSVDK